MTSSVVARYNEAAANNDRPALKALRTEDWVAEWPQSGERIRGHENDLRIHENYPGYPDQKSKRIAGQPEQWAVSPLNTMVRTRGGGDLWIIEALFVYPEGPQHVVVIAELKDGLIARETQYWAAPFEAPAWRKDLVVPIPDAETFHKVESETAADVQARRQAAIERFVQVPAPGKAAGERRRLWVAGMKDVFHEDAVQDLPQSGERIESLAKMIEVVERHPDFPKESQLRRVVGTGDLFLVELKTDYDDGTYWMTALLEFRGDRVARSIEYYAKSFDPPEWRAQWVERL